MMTEVFLPSVDQAIWRLRPDFVALSVVVRGGRNGPSQEVGADSHDTALIAQAPSWGEAHLEAWRQAYTAFGAKPRRTPSSAEALRRRVERDGTLPRINAIVDLYNALSVRYALPIGGEDLAAYRGTPRLVRAQGSERFDTMRDGQPSSEVVDPGEVVWRDDTGVTCRRWNWRQSVRTRLEIRSTEMWFVLERLEPMPLADLHEAGAALVSALVTMAPGAQVTTTVISP
jgi:DNA/RNA-binding domain of Phe-tRNA-synthetase-like protein